MYEPHLLGQGYPAPLGSVVAKTLQTVSVALDLLNTQVSQRPELSPIADKLREVIKELADQMQPERNGPIGVVPMMPPRH